MKLDGRVMTIPQLEEHVASLAFAGPFQPKFICVHNTDVPSVATFNGWIKRGSPTPEQWGRNLAAYYVGEGFPSMPHAFTMPDGRVLLGAPFNIKGTHTPSWNGIAIGIENVGNFDNESWGGPESAALVGLLAALHNRLKLDPANYVRGVRGLHFHKEDSRTTHKNCPGKNMVKAPLVAAVVARMKGLAADSVDNGEHVVLPDTAAVVDASSLTDYEAISPWWVQLTLRSLGYKLGIDGKIGDETKSIVKQFQAKHPPLVVDGIAGSATRIALKAAKEA